MGFEHAGVLILNAPMSKKPDIVYAGYKGFKLPDNVKKLLVGSVATWYDADPLSQQFDEELNFYFDPKKISATKELLLIRHGFKDVSQFINVSLKWRVKMELVYSMPNRGKEHREILGFDLHGLIYPMNKKFIDHRDKFYLLHNMEFLAVPDDHKNKKVYKTSKFTATVIGI